ncbi:hypothetical protein PO909_018096 [Leuciscus waleckii]
MRPEQVTGEEETGWRRTLMTHMGERGGECSSFSFVYMLCLQIQSDGFFTGHHVHIISDGPSEQDSCGNWSLSRSDSLQEMMCSPLPGQVPVGPTVTSNGLTPQGAVEASPANKSSTENPSECRKRNGICSFLMSTWKAMKQHFGCCCHSSAVDVVEPFVPPPNLDPEPDPDHSVVKPNNGKMIGSGGFGRVYEGTRKFDGKKVAIKQISKIDNNRYLDIPGHPEPLVTEVALLLMMRQEPSSPYVI